MSVPNFRTQRFSNEDVHKACDVEASNLIVPEGIDPFILMLAIASVESGGGDPTKAGWDCGPRYEKAYDLGGSFWKISHQQRDLVEKFGGQAACSFGPWQMMYCNFPFLNLGPQGITTPESLLGYSDFQAAVSYAGDFSQHFNMYVPRLGPKTIEEIGEIWNSGHIVRAVETDYAHKLVNAYNKSRSYKPS